MNNVTKIVNIFKSNRKTYERIFIAIKNKYESLGNFSGSIEINNLNEYEKSFLARIDSKYINSINAKVSVNKIICSFKGTIIKEEHFKIILEEYFGEKFITKREYLQNNLKEEEKFFQNIIDIVDLKVKEWLIEVKKYKRFGYMSIKILYDTNKKELEKVIFNLNKAIKFLEFSKEPVRISILATQISGDPHYLDKGRNLTIFLHILAYINKLDFPSSVEEERELLYLNNVIKDELWNFTTIVGLKAKNGYEYNSCINAFYDQYEILQLNLINLNKITSFSCNKNILYIFENPSVFSEVYNKCKYSRPSLMCSNGQLNLSSYLILDKLIKFVDKIYYSGDFDPEGIEIADKLKKKYGEKLILWGFNEENYLASLSEKTISKERLKRIEKIKDKDLFNLCFSLKEKKLCGYQEKILDFYINHILNEIKA